VDFTRSDYADYEKTMIGAYVMQYTAHLPNLGVMLSFASITH